MILTANSAAAHQTNRRRTGNGRPTTFIGKNRNTLKEARRRQMPTSFTRWHSWSRKTQLRSSGRTSMPPISIR